MVIKPLTDQYFVSPQISVTDVETLAEKGFRTIVCNRPDGESPDQEVVEVISAAAAGFGIDVHYLPVQSGGLQVADAIAQGELLSSVEGPVLAYCRSGTRCTMLWALDLAINDKMPRHEIQQRASAVGYDVAGLLAQVR